MTFAARCSSAPRCWMAVAIVFALLGCGAEPALAARSSVYQFSAYSGTRRAYLWIPPRCLYVRGIIMALSNLTERAWLEDPILRRAAADECLGIVWLGSGSGTPLDSGVSPAGGAALDMLLGHLARESGYPEIADAPLIPMGHSANGPFAWNFARLHPDRTIAAIPIKTLPMPPTLGFQGVPLLYLVGETTEWPQFRVGSRPGDRDFFWPVVRDTALALRHEDAANLIGVVTDPGGGHFDWSDRDARMVALFIRKACRFRLPKRGTPPRAGGRVVLRALDAHQGWLTDTGGPQSDRFPAASYNAYRGEASQAFWFFDEEMARAAVAFCGDRRLRLKQMLTFLQDGEALPVAGRGFAKLRFEPLEDGASFRLEGGFLSSVPPELVGAGTPLGHAAGRIRFSVITGPAVQTGADSFRLQFDRGTLDGPQQPKESAIWIKSFEPGQFEWTMHVGGKTRRKDLDLEVTGEQAGILVRPLFPETLPGNAGLSTDYPEKMRLVEKTGLKDHDTRTPDTYFSFQAPELTRRTKFIVAVTLVNDRNRTNLPKIERLQTLDMNGVRIHQNGTVTDVYLNLLADGRIRHRNANATIEGWETDAYLMALTFPEGADKTDIDAASRVFLADGSYLRRNGKVVLDSLSKVFMVETREGNNVNLLLQGQPRIDASIHSGRKPTNVLLNGSVVNVPFDPDTKTFSAHLGAALK